MEAAHTSAPDTFPLVGEATAAPAPVNDSQLRRCLVTGAMLPKSALLRFVVGPDQVLFVDLAQNLPGRGLWVTPTAEAITLAAKKNLFAKAAKTSVTVAPDLAADVAKLMRKRCLDMLGMAKRSGIAVLGQAQVEGELKAGRLSVLLMSDDAGSDLSAFRATKDAYRCHHFTRSELGAALGQDVLVYVGIKPHALTKKLQTELERLDQISPLNMASLQVAMPQPSDTMNG